MYYNGWGVPRDFKESIKYYRMAAKQGHAGAQWILGYMYDNGWGVPLDYIQAYKMVRYCGRERSTCRSSLPRHDW